MGTGKQSQSDAEIKVADGQLSVRVALTQAEARHLESQRQEGELAVRAAALYLLRRALLKDAAVLAKQADEARDAKIAAARGGKGPPITMDVPVARGAGKGRG